MRALVAQRLDRVEPGGAPRGIERRKERKHEAYPHHHRHLAAVDFRRKLREKVDFLGEHPRAGQRFDAAPDGLDIVDEGETGGEAETGPDHPDGRPGDEEDAQDHAARRAMRLFPAVLAR